MPSVQALASNFLRLFRVQQIAVLPLDMTSLKDARGDPTIGETISQVLSDQVKIRKQPGEPHDLSDAGQASQEAGFQVRLSSDPAHASQELMLADRASPLRVPSTRPWPKPSCRALARAILALPPAQGWMAPW